MAFVAVDEKIVLIFYDGTHRTLKRVLALSERLDEPFGRIDFLLYE